jgi:hypothetical protein
MMALGTGGEPLLQARNFTLDREVAPRRSV